MFGTIVDKLKTLLSRSFLLGSFFPVFVFSLLNFAIMWIGLDGFSRSLLPFRSMDTTHATAATALALIVIAIFAFILSPLIPLFRLILEGEFLFQFIRRRLIAYHARRADNLYEVLKRITGGRNALQIEMDFARKSFRDARADTTIQRNNGNPKFQEEAASAIETLEKQIANRIAIRDVNDGLPSVSTVRNATDKLKDALKNYCMTPGPDDNDNSRSADRLQRKLLHLITRACHLADAEIQEAGNQYYTYAIEGAIRPTSLGNARAALENYSGVTYKASFDFIWPRLRLVLSKNRHIADDVETASAQLDFAILMTVLSFLTTVIWCVALPLCGTSPLLFLIIILLGPTAVLFFYRLVYATQQAFGSVSATAIDGLRFELLRALHVPLPTSIAREQELWRSLELAVMDQGDDEIRYRHGSL